MADLVSGVISKNYKTVDLGTLTFDKAADGKFTVNLTSLNAKKKGICMCDKYAYATTTWMGEYTFGITDNVTLWIQDSRYTTAASFKEAVSGVVVYYELSTPTTETFDTLPIPTASGNNELTLDTEVTPTSIDVTSFGDYYTKSEVDKMVNDLQPMFYSSLDTNKVRVTFDSFPTDRIYLINIRFAVDGNTFVCNLSSPRNSVNNQYFTTFARYGGKNHTVTGYLNMVLENKEVVATLLNVELDGESIANPTVTRLILSCIK